MSNPPSEQPNPSALDEQLVAYLDGELAPEASKQVEEVLAGDESARNRLSQLAASWDLLDQLPRATVDDMFTRTTVQMVAVAAEDELAQVSATQPAVKRRRWLEGALATAVAAAIGFVVISVGLPSENKSLLRDLSVVHDLEQYQEAGSLDYLLQLQKTRLIPDDSMELSSPGNSAGSSASAVAGDGHAGASNGGWLRPVPRSTDERRAWVDALSPAEKLELRDNFEKFASLPPQQQDALRHFDKQLYANPDAAQLHGVLHHYYEWLRKTVSPLDRQELKNEANIDQRLATARQLKQNQEQRVFASLSRADWIPRDRDNMEVIKWLRKFVENHQSELVEIVGDTHNEAGKSNDPRRARPPIMLAYSVWWAPLATRSAPVSDAEMDALVAKLSPERQEQFAAAAGNRSARLSLIDKWIQRAVEIQILAQGGFRGGRRVNLDQLTAFEERDLTDKQRQELKELPSDQQFRKVLEWFMQSNRSGRGQRFPGGFQRPPPDGAPGGPPPGTQPPGGPPPRDQRGPGNDRA